MATPYDGIPSSPRRSSRARKSPAYLADFVCEGSTNAKEAKEWLDAETDEMEKDISDILERIDGILKSRGSRSLAERLINRAYDRFDRLKNLVQNRLIYLKSDAGRKKLVAWCNGIQKIIEKFEDETASYIDSRQGEPPSECGDEVTKSDGTLIDVPNRGQTPEQETEDAESDQEESDEEMLDAEQDPVNLKSPRLVESAVKQDSLRKPTVTPPVKARQSKSNVHIGETDDDADVKESSSKSRKGLPRVNSRPKTPSRSTNTQGGATKPAKSRLASWQSPAGKSPQFWRQLPRRPSATTFQSPYTSVSEQYDDESEEEEPEDDADLDRLFKGMAKPQLPTFDGRRERFHDWQAQFEIFVNQLKAPVRYKMVLLKSTVTGRAKQLVERLGYTQSQYEMALFKLNQRYGGEQRLIQQQMNYLMGIPPIEGNDLVALEDLSNRLCDMVAKLQDLGRDQELVGYSSLYALIQEKIPEKLLVSYLDTRDPEDDGLGCFVEWLNHQVCLRLEAQELTHHRSKAKQSKAGNVRSKKPNHSSRSNGTKSEVQPPEATRGNCNSVNTANTNQESIKKNIRLCPVCNEEHPVVDCRVWRSSKVNKRWQLAKAHRLCYRCLRDNHLGTSCRVEKTCGVEGCLKNHHRDLHYLPKNEKPERKRESTGTAAFGVTGDGKVMVTKVALRLLPVRIVGADGNVVEINAFLDDGSDSSYLRTEVAKQLGLKPTSTSLSISTLIGDSKFDSGLVACQIESMAGDLRREIGVRTLDEVCKGLPIPDWQRHKSGWPHLQDINFHHLPGRKTVDLLIGADHPELTLALEERIGQPGDPVARLTPLGWTCIGTLDPSIEGRHQSWAIYGESSAAAQVESCFKKLWNMDLIEEKNEKSLSPDEKLALKKAQDSRRCIGDRYEMGIPWKEDKPTLIDNRAAAERRLRSLEFMLRKKPDVADKYKTAFNANIEKGYIKKISAQEASKPGWYLPHFAVFKEEKETTKVRIVYDAAAVYEGSSLNEQMLTGPRLQSDIVEIMMRFRRRPVALVGDIKEMFSQVALAPIDQKYHRLLWRNLDSQQPIETYEAVRLVFGDRSSPFLAQYVLQQQALDAQDQYPTASEVALKSIYMDDVLDSFETEGIAKQVRQDLGNLMLPSGFLIRRWCSNSLEVLEGVAEEDRAVGVRIEESALPSLKTLGIWWDASNDYFTFKVSLTDSDVVVNSKRKLLSRIATCFDPFQFLAPLLIRGKILLQEAWLQGLDWDENFPQDLQQATDKWMVEMKSVGHIRIPRCFRNQPEDEVKSVTVHTFGDASKMAYAAVVYLRFVFKNGSIHVVFVIAKARVTPLRAITIPRLELMAAVLGVRLSHLVAEVLKIPIQEHRFWSDSTDVVHWVHGQSRKYKSFVANRVSEIHEKTNPSQWSHVPGKDNPADDATRGLDVRDLDKNGRWFHGAEFLWLPEDEWPKPGLPMKELSEEAAEEISKTGSANINSTQSVNVPVGSKFFEVERYSSWLKAVRVLAWVLRTSSIIKKKAVSPTLSVSELQLAEVKILQQVQVEAFGGTISNLQSSEKSNKGHLKDLHPFVDDNGLLRVGGRLQSSDLPYDTKHPIILPKDHHVTTLIIRWYHLQGRHVRGVNGLLADTRTRFWIVRGREAIKRYVRCCVPCQKSKKKISSQLMAPLPGQRVNPIRAFSSCGVDYGGPFLVKITRNVRDKRYLCLFTCNASRAVHLEVAFSLETSGFLQAFSRMVARRGRPVEVVSDNGTNFVGANRELTTLLAAMNQDTIQDKMSSMGVKWKFNTPLASHHGGVFESMIKAAKRALHSIIGESNLREEELLTAVAEVEGLLNSRPLGYSSSDPKDDVMLTPNHFLYGQAGGQLAPSVVDEIAFSPRNRWRYVQDLVLQVWKRWQHEYLHSLQQRPKWFEEAPNLKPDDVVMMVDQSCPRGKWPLARVTDVYPGEDGLVRTVRVVSGGKSYLRPIVKLCPLEL